MGKLIGLHINSDDDFSLLDRIKKDKWLIQTFEEGVNEFIASVLGIEPELLKDRTVLNSYLGEEWSYIREERFVGQGTKPVRYFLSPKVIKAKLIESFLRIHSRFLINMTLKNRPNEHEKDLILLITTPDELMAVKEAGGFTIFYRPVSMKGQGPVLSRIRNKFDRTCADENEVLKVIEMQLN